VKDSCLILVGFLLALEIIFPMGPNTFTPHLVIVSYLLMFIILGKTVSFDKKTVSFDKKTVSFDKKTVSFDKKTVSFDKKTDFSHH
jgi:hypothetical protein